MISRRAVSIPSNTVWPDALPKANENFYFSINVCENSRLVWGFHDVNDDANCTIWRCVVFVSIFVYLEWSFRNTNAIFLNTLVTLVSYILSTKQSIS